MNQIVFFLNCTQKIRAFKLLPHKQNKVVNKQDMSIKFVPEFPTVLESGIDRKSVV